MLPTNITMSVKQDVSKTIQQPLPAVKKTLMLPRCRLDMTLPSDTYGKLLLGICSEIISIKFEQYQICHQNMTWHGKVVTQNLKMDIVRHNFVNLKLPHGRNIFEKQQKKGIRFLLEKGVRYIFCRVGNRTNRKFTNRNATQ